MAHWAYEAQLRVCVQRRRTVLRAIYVTPVCEEEACIDCARLQGPNIGAADLLEFREGEFHK